MIRKFIKTISLVAILIFPLSESLCAAESDTHAVRIGIYYQGQEFEAEARKVQEKLAGKGLRAVLEQNASRQMPAWANSVRFFHSEDESMALQLSEQLAGIHAFGVRLKTLDLSESFKNVKIRPRSFEVWICDEAKNLLLPKEAYELKYEASLAAKATVVALASQVVPDSTTITVSLSPTVTPDANDPYCLGWPLADRSAFLDRQKEEESLNDPPSPDSSKFVFYNTPARHDHGLPTGNCGVRLKIYKKDAKGAWQQSGFWEDLMAGDVLGVWPGDHYCLFEIDYETENSFLRQVYMIDDSGTILDKGPTLEPGEAIWIKHEGQEMIWQMDDKGILLKTPQGKVAWSRQESREGFLGHCFAPNKLWAFRQLKEEPAQVAIYSADGKQVFKFEVPFAKDKAQKGYLSLNDQGELVIRVNRRIYRVDHEGKAHLEAVLPIYKGRHRSIETMGPGVHFDVDAPGGRSISYDYATNVDRPYDHPRPMLRFDINTFEAEESLDEGKKWHALNIKTHIEPTEK